MNPERWQKIERIFGEAVALPPFAREDFLVDACAGDFHLREEIKSMLAKDANDEFLGESVFGAGVQLLFGTDDLLSESTFGSYELEKLLGRGGMGSVYLARDRRLDRLVALKVLPASIIENTKDVERFRQEARTASGISHSNVAHIYEFGEARNRWFLAMEYVEGKNLREMMKSQPLDRREILKIVCQITDALTATHRRGIVHRDIKPENIIVADDGTVKVLDFGLAKPDSPSIEDLNDSLISQSDSSEMLFGTVAYMSPEQIRGEAFDARTDLWSLGVLLFEMLSGKRPFVSDAGNELPRMILNQPIKIADCPKSFRPLVGKLLEKNPADRYRSAAELSEDLRLLKENLDTGNNSSSVIGKVKSRLTIVAILLIIFFGLSAAGSQIYFSFAPLASKTSTYDSIAILPFVSENDGENDDYLSDGLTESLIGKLSRLSNVSVKSKNSVFRYKGKSIVPQTIGKELAVQAILTGRIREQNDFINLDIELADTRTGNQIWTKQYNCRKTELITLQREMERDVFANLNSLTSDADERILGKNYTENPEAYRLYLRGRFHWNKRTAKDLMKAIEYYEQAIAADQNFALAYAALADTYLITSGYGIHSPRESFPKAKEMALKALKIDDTLAEAHNALSYELCNYEWNIAEAEKEIKLAIKLNPNYPTAHQWYSTAILTATGRFDEAVAEAQQAQKLDSVSLSVNTDLGSVLLFARREDEALEQLKKTVEMDENFGNARAYLCRAYLMKKDFPAAITECRKGQSLYNDPRPTAYLARVYAEQGERRKALEIVAQLKNPNQEKYVSKYYFAIIYAGLGETDQAFEYLNQAFQEREGRMLLLKFDPLMDKLSADPRFDEMIRRIQSSTNSS